MNRVTKTCLALGFLVVAAAAYQVHEQVEEDDETVRGKRQESGGAYIDSIFNIPIAAIQQTSVAAQTLSPANAATIDSVLKIPVTTLQAVSALIKNRQHQQNRYPETTPQAQPIRRLDAEPAASQPSSTSAPSTPSSGTVSEAVLRRREQLRQRMEAQRERQRVWEEQLHRRRMEQLQKYNRRMQEYIVHEDERQQHRYHRDPFGFGAIAKWLAGSDRRVFNGHAGHGDGHVYQYYDRERPLGAQSHLHERRPQSQLLKWHQDPDAQTLAPLEPTQAPSTSTSSTSSSRPVSSSTLSANPTVVPTSATTSSSPPRPIHIYAVQESIDESANPFAWPNWFGILDALRKPAKYQPALQNKIAPKDEEYYKYKHAQARKNSGREPSEREITGNEVDEELVDSVEVRLRDGERTGRVLFPTN